MTESSRAVTLNRIQKVHSKFSGPGKLMTNSYNLFKKTLLSMDNKLHPLTQNYINDMYAYWHTR